MGGTTRRTGRSTGWTRLCRTLTRGFQVPGLTQLRITCTRMAKKYRRTMPTTTRSTA